MQDKDVVTIIGLMLGPIIVAAFTLRCAYTVAPPKAWTLPAIVARGTRRNVTWITSPSSRKVLSGVGRKYSPRSPASPSVP